jgi:hypothetical protein
LADVVAMPALWEVCDLTPLEVDLNVRSSGPNVFDIRHGPPCEIASPDLFYLYPTRGSAHVDR